MTVTDIAIALLRALSLAGLALFAGAVFFRLVLLPSSAPDGETEQKFERAWRYLCAFALFLSAAGLVLWVPLQFISLAGSAENLSAVFFSALSGTAFGVASCLRALAIIVALILLRPAEKSLQLRVVLLLVAIFALTLQIRMGHAAASDTLWLPVAVVAHIIAAALWFGSLAPLYLLLRLSPEAGLRAARHFSLFGMVFVAVLVAGAVVAGYLLSGGVAGLIGTAYGNIILLKIALLVIMLLIAALNRFYLSGAQRSGQGLKAALIVEAATGLAVFLAASLLATQPPAVHGTIVWPFAYRLRDTIFSDPFLLDALWRSLQPVVLAVVLGIACWFLPRWRWAAIALIATIVLVVFQPPRAGLFLLEANEASFLRSPTSYSTISVARGASAFAVQCATCHGDDGRGRGVQATGDPVWPPDLTAPLFAERSDGELYHTILKGRFLPDGRQSMPAFENSLDAKNAWSLVDYIRTIASARTISMPAPDGEVYAARAPLMSVYCRGNVREAGRKSDTAWLVVRDRSTLSAFTLDAAGRSEACEVADQSALVAFSLLTPESVQDGFLIDQDGWIRFRWRGAVVPAAEELAKAVVKTRENPVLANTAGHH